VHVPALGVQCHFHAVPTALNQPLGTSAYFNNDWTAFLGKLLQRICQIVWRVLLLSEPVEYPQ
jgi:hypothetical protein